MLANKGANDRCPLTGAVLDRAKTVPTEPTELTELAALTELAELMELTELTERSTSDGVPVALGPPAIATLQSRQ